MPFAPLRNCSADPRCPNRTKGGGPCDVHRRQVHSASWARHNAGRTSTQRGYGVAWRRLRDQILREQPLCEVCESRGRLTPASTVDHVIAKEHGGSDDRANLRSICTPCHRTKTGRDRWTRGLKPGAVLGPSLPNDSGRQARAVDLSKDLGGAQGAERGGRPVLTGPDDQFTASAENQKPVWNQNGGVRGR